MAIYLPGPEINYRYILGNILRVSIFTGIIRQL